MRFIIKGILAAALAGGCSAARQSRSHASASGAMPPREYPCVRIDRPPEIDGRLDDDAWTCAAWSADFVDIEGVDGPPPRYRTRMKMVWDETCVYLAAELEEPHVWATLRERDEIVFHDNDFEVFIDPNGDGREYYELEINALNTVFDLFLVRTYIEGGPALHDWNMGGLRTGVHISGSLNEASDVDEGWIVEMALPWRSLAEAAGCGAPPCAGDVWRMNFSRVEWHHRIVERRYEKIPDSAENNWVWSPQGVVDMHRPQHWGFVHFVDGRSQR